MKIQFTSTPKTFNDPNTGRNVDYIERCITIDDIEYKVGKLDAKVFDVQFKELINGPCIEVDD